MSSVVDPSTSSQAQAISSLEIESSDVVRIVLQFLKENNLTESMQMLQKESGITLNTVDSIENFAADIRNGRWDAVLQNTSLLRLPGEKLIYLYEQVIFELLEVGERDLAKEILRSSDPLSGLKSTHPERYLKLEQLCRKPYFNSSDAYELGSSKETKRQEIAESLICEVSAVQPSRLLSLLGQALKYQQAQGLLPPGVPFDLFRGSRKAIRKDVEEKLPKKLAGALVLSKDSSAESILFSPDGQSLITGSIDGFIEAWDFESQKLRQDLEYQARGEFLMQEGAVQCCTFSKDSDHLATGSQTGQIKIWKLSSGLCLRKFNQAHPLGITSLSFARDSTQILSTSYDHTARIHGLKSGKTLKEFRGHTSFVNCGLYAKDNANHVITGASDGTVKLWDIRSTECLLTFRPGSIAGSVAVLRETAVNTVQIMPTNPEQLFICVGSSQAFIMTVHGQLVKSFSSGKVSGGDFLCATLSPQGKFIYCVAEDGIMYAFDVKGGQLESVLTISEGTVVSVSHHPHRNLIATISDHGKVKLWRP